MFQNVAYRPTVYRTGAEGVILINTDEVSVRLLSASDARARPLFNAIVLLPKRH